MLGTFQQSQLRIEIDASGKTIHTCVMMPEKFKQWLWPQRFSDKLPQRLQVASQFQSWVGSIAIEHQVERASDNFLRVLLSQGVDGYHEWYWGDGWIQTRLEGVSLLPLSAGLTFSLFRLRQYIAQRSTD